MKFTVPCFVRVEDEEKRKELITWLNKFGYKVYEWYWGQYIRVVRCWTTPKGISKAVGYPCKQVRKTDIDCGSNIELFKALAAINDENDREQWFTNGTRWYLCQSKKVHPDYKILGYHKATVEEIIERYKDRQIIN